jgi:tRNA pseudouridine38-40 synthase
MRNIKLIIEYDGTDFCGWQCQPNVPTVQGEIERSLSQITQQKVKLTPAGRTDAGVHAVGQVANFKTESDLPVQAFVRGGNAKLPHSIRLKSAKEVAMDFNSRYNAKSREYRYQIHNQPIALGRQYSCYVSKKLVVEKMNEACEYLIGINDFEAFCQTGARLDHYRCNVILAEWKKNKNGLTFEIKSNRFVHNMVRIIVGTCLMVGREKINPAKVLSILNSKDRTKAGSTVPPHGLCLVKVEYDL